MSEPLKPVSAAAPAAPSAADEIQKKEDESRRRRTIFLLFGVGVSLLIPLLGVVYLKLVDRAAGTASANPTWEKRETGDERIVSASARDLEMPAPPPTPPPPGATSSLDFVKQNEMLEQKPDPAAAGNALALSGQKIRIVRRSRTPGGEPGGGESGGGPVDENAAAAPESSAAGTASAEAPERPSFARPRLKADKQIGGGSFKSQLGAGKRPLGGGGFTPGKSTGFSKGADPDQARKMLDELPPEAKQALGR